MGRRAVSYWKLVPLAGALAIALVINAWLILASVFTLPQAVDWWIIDRAAGLAGDPALYAPRGSSTFIWSPIAAYALQLITPLGPALWRVVTVTCALAMPTWPTRLLLLVSGPFWFDFANGNVTTFILLLAAWSLHGSRLATAGFMGVGLLIPRPLFAPLLLWLLWKRPGWRLPFVALFIIHGGLVLATGLTETWWTTVMSVTPGIQDGGLNMGPTQWLDYWWFVGGIPLAGWLTYRGRVGLAGLALSPYIWPYYLMFVVPDVNRPGTRLPITDRRDWPSRPVAAEHGWRNPPES